MKCSTNRVEGKVLVGAILLLSAFYALALPNLPTPWLLAALVVHSASLATVIIYSVLCSVLPMSLQIKGYERFCEKCSRQVDLDSVHCEECRVCVSGFRLHSEWLNCCIGARNAKSYAGVLVGMVTFCGVQVMAEGWVATVAVMGGTKGQSITQVSPTQAYSLQDNGYLYKLTLLFAAAVSLALCLGGVSHLLRYYVRQRSRQLHAGVSRTVPVNCSREVEYREQGKDAANEQSLVTFCQPVADESRFEQVRISIDFTKNEGGGKDRAYRN